jgi:acetyl-CoA carboxylase biotin carboxyl carrier protein
MMVSIPAQQMGVAQTGMQLPEGTTTPAKPKQDHSIPIVAPLTGVYYSSPSPTLPPFVSPGDIVHIGQVVALVEAMKVFNEIQAEVSGRVVAMVATNGEVVQKGDALIRVEPL